MVPILILMVPLYYLLTRTRLKPRALAIALTLSALFLLLTILNVANGQDSSGVSSLFIGFLFLTGVLFYDQRHEKSGPQKPTPTT